LIALEEDQQMSKLLAQLWRDERGCVPATEWMLVASILTLGTIGVLLTMHYSENGPDNSFAMLIYSGLLQK
jgi:Flp pilus assembly pilin Flp